MKQKESKRPSNTEVTTVPFSCCQSRFLEAPLVRQADGELTISTTLITLLSTYQKSTAKGNYISRPATNQLRYVFNSDMVH